ncbi:CPXCG motif-containing cysteine-rich protein [Thiomicrospira microaerophila]|uniref:CPXCG motif-containing cysteine-rich protein n=1 Tax=Thiomicrospira microaerophila TaxID=406020 RepID=UPI00200F02E1|nr:CPXCG motif-containing cysteine-rich protein [Thiomicrospira microaerophila]UQB42298.1 CPXCG motif-containing cysteine-rich protein [Thiomicrospira microaerophila]
MLATQFIQCPYCWQQVEIVIDPSEPEQDYIEDCYVCCRPIQLKIKVGDDGELEVQARSEDESF